MELGRLRADPLRERNHVSNLVRSGLARPMPSGSSAAPVALGLLRPAGLCITTIANGLMVRDAREGPCRSGRVGSTTKGKRTGRGTVRGDNSVNDGKHLGTDMLHEGLVLLFPIKVTDKEGGSS